MTPRVPNDGLADRVYALAAHCPNSDCGVESIHITYNPPARRGQRMVTCPACGFPLEVRGRIYAARSAPDHADRAPVIIRNHLRSTLRSPTRAAEALNRWFVSAQRERVLRALDRVADTPTPQRIADAWQYILSCPDPHLAAQAARVMNLLAPGAASTRDGPPSS